mgnify:FL=1
MNKNIELATALSYVKEKLKVSVTDAVAASTQRAGVETTAENWRKIRSEVETAIENTVNDSHRAFGTLLK